MAMKPLLKAIALQTTGPVVRCCCSDAGVFIGWFGLVWQHGAFGTGRFSTRHPWEGSHSLTNR
jgi:hypothetical protein